MASDQHDQPSISIADATTGDVLLDRDNNIWHLRAEGLTAVTGPYTGDVWNWADLSRADLSRAETFHGPFRLLHSAFAAGPPRAANLTLYGHGVMCVLLMLTAALLPGDYDWLTAGIGLALFWLFRRTMRIWPASRTKFWTLRGLVALVFIGCEATLVHQNWATLDVSSVVLLTVLVLYAWSGVDAHEFRGMRWASSVKE